MTEDFIELQGFVDRMTVDIWSVIAFWVIALIAICVLLFWPFKEGDEE